jgi:autotransporter translocation and assembly factor TamB
VHGSVDATYVAATETLDLGNSSLSLPSTQVDFSGVLGRQLHVHAISHNLDDVLPAFNVQSLPVRLHNGEAAFDGTVAGKLDDPRITGHGRAGGVVWQGRTYDALDGQIDLTGTGIVVNKGSVQQGPLHAEGTVSIGMRDWTVGDSSPVTVTGVIKNAPAQDLLAVADVKDAPITGSANVEGKVTGVIVDGEAGDSSACGCACPRARWRSEGTDA